MNDSIDIKLDRVSKKYCKSLKRSMRYGVGDITRNAFGLSSRSSTLRKDEFWAVDDVSFEVRRGETIGIIGPNGSGKTTLLKMLNGIFWPDKGKITVKGKVGALIAVGAGFHPALTGRENIYVNAAILGMNKKEVEERFDSILKFADIGDFIDTPVKYYSSGMFVRLGFAVAIHCDPDILLVDEVLAVGDSGFRTKCLRRIADLREDGLTTVLVSHSMNLITVYSDRVILMNHGTTTKFDDPGEAAKQYASLFVSNNDGSGVEKICSGTKDIRFFDVHYTQSPLSPGDSFSISMQYESVVDFPDVAVETRILSAEGAYFQATNKAYNQRIDLRKGHHSLVIEIKGITLNNAVATLPISIWTKHKEFLFWWRIPVEFKGVAHATGSNFLQVLYDTETAD